MKKTAAMILALVLTLSLSAAAMAEDTYRVGICQLVQHVALDAATQGFQDALKEKLGDKVTFDVQNASGDSNTCSTIVNNFISGGVNLIMANATPALQAAVAATGDIPILGTSVTDYATALDIDDWNGATGMNVSGTSDLAPLEQQANMLHELFPDAKKVGLLYCSAEPNSKYQVAEITGYLTALGYATGEMAYEVLVNGADVATMNVRFAPNVTKEYNAEMCALLGVQIPEDYVAIQ